eukprot:COSAG06_NODE_9909_length_1791_cov_13.558511_2_plen_189_part_00
MDRGQPRRPSSSCRPFLVELQPNLSRTPHTPSRDAPRIKHGLLEPPRKGIRTALSTRKRNICLLSSGQQLVLGVVCSFGGRSILCGPTPRQSHSLSSVPPGPVLRSPGRRRALLQIAVGRSPPLGYRRLDDAPPAREGTREIKRSESPPPPSPSGLMIKWIIGIKLKVCLSRKVSPCAGPAPSPRLPA